MTRPSDSGSFLRRYEDLPILVLSQDYELFFGRSGSIQKCLFEPCDMLTEWARARDLSLTFYVDAGMLCAMESHVRAERALGKDLSDLKCHIESLADQGHEIGLHIHPHWEDSRRKDGVWDFSNTRYKLADFSDEEVAEIVRRYAGALNDLCDGRVESYRAGGFCVEPFSLLRDHLLGVGIDVDSSVVPGLLINDPNKGVSFDRDLPDDLWFFSTSPTVAENAGEFVEIPVTPQVLPFFHYWGRLRDRLFGRKPPTVLGDGTAKPIGWKEIGRRLSGVGRTSELSLDAPKAGRLESGRILREKRKIWHIMGHPKLLGSNSLKSLEQFIAWKKIHRSVTVAGLARAIRAQNQ